MHILPGLKPSWENFLLLNRTRQKPNLFGSLHTRVAKLVTIASPTDLNHATKAEQIEMAPNLTSGANKDKRTKIHFEVEGESREEEVALMWYE